MLDVNLFEQLRIGLASADDIRKWSHGEVKKPETINYRTLKPEKDGLFCEKIFGPTRDWECYCGKYKRVRYKGIVCERCGVEVTRSKVRRDRMGHIELSAPVTHIWYFKGVPSRMGYLLDLAPKDLEKVIYFAANMITFVDEAGRHENLPRLEQELTRKINNLSKKRDEAIEVRAQAMETELAALEAEGAKADQKRKTRENGERDMAAIRKNFDTQIEKIQRVFDRFKNLKVQDLEGDAQLYTAMRTEYGRWFEGGMGAAAVQKRLANFDLEAESIKLRDIVKNGKGQKKTRALKRLKVVQSFINTGTSPAAMVLDVVPVIPPDLRPMVQLDGGRFATSDLNDLYRRVITRNTRLKRLLDLNAPEIIVNNEKRMLQEAVDALFDNGRRGRPVTGQSNRPLKSLSDMLKGKQGRFRQNLLGKRVDYSGRSVIVAGPTLKLHQCGLPKQMALELFKPFVMKRLVDLNHAQNIKSAKRMVERSRSIVWDVLEEVITEHPVLLNRAPTLHRLGIQAFEPKLIEGKAIQIHPLVCVAFNADFDGDQMAVHVPLSAEAQAEARILMLSSNNILSPASGKPITTPTQDMVLGIYHLTGEDKGAAGEGRAFTSMAEAIMAYDRGDLSLRAKVKIRLDNVTPGPGMEAPEGFAFGDSLLVETTLGRAFFNDALPADYPFVNTVVGKKQLGDIINRMTDVYPKVAVAGTLDNLKELGFHWATRSGVSIGIVDVVVPEGKAARLAQAEDDAAKIDKNYDRGLITAAERRKEQIDIWTKATDEIGEEMLKNFDASNPVFKMADSGARGNMLQVRQLAGMRGLVANTKGEIMPRPIKSNFREGLSMLEYFISAYGARKGLADTALRTADAGYLTRRLVDVSQDVIIREADCGTERGMDKIIGDIENGVVTRHAFAETAVVSRAVSEDVVDAAGNVLAERNTVVTNTMVDAFIAAGVSAIKVRSVLTCESKLSTCGACYGYSLATNRPVEIGEAIGIIAAQSIGEPGTQLTMRTFHTGGAVGEGGARDITHGLPRVVELFEARDPKGKAIISPVDGVIRLEESDKDITLFVIPDDGSDEIKFKGISKAARLLKQAGDRVEVGQKITEGVIDPKDKLEVQGVNEAQKFLVDQVQEVYRGQGQSIHDKHIEVIVRQMLRRIIIVDSGDTDFLDGDLVDRSEFTTKNREVAKSGGQPATGRPELMGITKASLATESWLSAASFQETTKVLTDAALQAKSDRLLGLKENVILGKLIPAGTGLAQYRNVTVSPTDEAKAALYANISSYADDYGDIGFGSGSGEAVRLDDVRLNEDFY
ncbi:MAG: hypothetical protein RL038_324 [Actinomycetota bacterium]